MRLYQKTDEPLVLQDEEEEEREQQENELVSGETTVVLGRKEQSLPSRKTVSCERAVSEIDKIENIKNIGDINLT